MIKNVKIYITECIENFSFSFRISASQLSLIVIDRWLADSIWLVPKAKVVFDGLKFKLWEREPSRSR